MWQRQEIHICTWSHMFWRENTLFLFLFLSSITRDGASCLKMSETTRFLNSSQFRKSTEPHFMQTCRCFCRFTPKGPNSAPALCGDGVPANARSATAWKLGWLASHVDAWLLVPQLTHGVDLNVEGWLLCWYEYEVFSACISYIKYIKCYCE